MEEEQPTTCLAARLQWWRSLRRLLLRSSLIWLSCTEQLELDIGLQLPSIKITLKNHKGAMSSILVIGAGVIAALVAYAYYEDQDQGPPPPNKQPFKNTVPNPPGCDQVSDGYYKCQQLGMYVSSYSVPGDPVKAPIKIGDKYYWFRQNIVK